MKVLDLCCVADHRFEGWFASLEAFESQMTDRLVACPVCGAVDVTRIPSAPRLNLSGAVAPRETRADVSGHRGDEASQANDAGGGRALSDSQNRAAGPSRERGAANRGIAARTASALASSHERSPINSPGMGAEQMRELQGRWMQAMREVMANTEDVGDRFAEEARRMHYRESSTRAIRGTASIEEALALEEEGIEVVAVPLPNALKERLQ